MKNIRWQKCIGTLIGAIWLYTLADIAGSITESINGLLNPVGFLGSLMGGEDNSPFGVGDLLEYLFPVLVLVGYLMFYSSLGRFVKLQKDQSDIEAASRVRSGYILLLIAVLVRFIPVAGLIIALVLTIIAYARMLSGFKWMSASANFSAEAQSGAALLRSATIWLLVGYILGCIPVVGGIIEAIISLVAFFCMLAGWRRIQNGAPEMSEEEAAQYAVEEQSNASKGISLPAWWLPAFVGVSLLAGILLLATGMKWIPTEVTLMWHPFFGDSYINVTEMTICIVGDLVLIGLCAFLLISRNVALNTGAKVGSILLIVSLLLQNIAIHGLHIPFRLEMSVMNFHMLRFYVLMVVNLICVTGILTLVWNTSVKLLSKIGFTAYEVLCLLNSYVLHTVVFRYAMNRGEHQAASQIANNFNDIYMLIISLLLFAAVLYGAISSKKQTKIEA